MLFYTLFFTTFAMVPVWFVLVSNLFRILRTRHPDKYSSMGNPTLFMNNSLATNNSMMRFLWGRQDRTLHDAELSKLTRFMLVFFIIYMVLFLITAIMIVTGYA